MITNSPKIIVLLQIPVAACALFGLADPVAVLVDLVPETVIVPPPDGRLFPDVGLEPPVGGIEVTGLLADAWQYCNWNCEADVAEASPAQKEVKQPMMEVARSQRQA